MTLFAISWNRDDQKQWNFAKELSRLQCKWYCTECRIMGLLNDVSRGMRRTGKTRIIFKSLPCVSFLLRINLIMMNVVIALTRLFTGVKFLNEQLRDDKFWTLTSITVIEETSIVKITNVPDNTTPQDIFRFLTNKSMVNNIKFKPNDVEVCDKYFRPQQGYCVVKLTSATGRHKICNWRQLIAIRTGYLLAINSDCFNHTQTTYL